MPHTGHFLIPIHRGPRGGRGPGADLALEFIVHSGANIVPVC